jgi:hypothetical protein
MANANFLNQIRAHMEQLQREFNALSEAYRILSVSGAGRGRKAILPTLSVSSDGTTVVRTGKRGRPPGAKNKPGYKKPGPKTNKLEEAKQEKKTGKPAKGNAKRQANKKKGRSRVPNLSGMIHDIISKGGRFTSNAQITDQIVSYYPDKSRADLGKYISVILSIMKSKKQLGAITEDAKGNRLKSGLWGLSNWFDNGKPKSQYMK